MPSPTPAIRALLDRGVAHRVHRYDHDPTVRSYGGEAAAALGIEPGQVFKTLVAEVDGGLVVAVVPITSELDLKALAAAMGSKRAALADPTAAERSTGYVIGGISPIGQKRSLPTVVDVSASSWPTIFVSGGRRGLEIELAPADLLAATDARLVDVAAPLTLGAPRPASRTMASVSRVVVLLGPPGSGKSTVGGELARLGLRWKAWEEVLLRRWGSRGHFLEHKDIALPQLHREIRAWIDEADQAAVFETTGLSDGTFLDHLGSERLLIVRLDVSESEALRRVAARPPGDHLSDDVDASRAVYRAFAAEVLPFRQAHLVVDTEQVQPGDVAQMVVEALRPTT